MKLQTNMTEQEILKYCHFYKGEAMIPQSLDQKNEGKLWVAEKAVCEDFSHLIDRDNPRRKIAEIVAAYVSKWSPMKFRPIMRTYFEKVSDLEDEIMRSYN